jgi:hypothetical protein
MIHVPPFTASGMDGPTIFDKANPAGIASGLELAPMAIV